ncbi:alanine dehydrogenase [Haloarcula quadrata]|uniref:Alanine dehydrogenase n=1 Tax=Haloarcula quadrata TaxID=182779 RepID=A0A495QQB8_9EURY|nr:ornithine cyclodeaminase family protein [Haloarcula quadrata]RKS75173.1 alanine dehydrogenase [Haloarcula quadrata]
MVLLLSDEALSPLIELDAVAEVVGDALLEQAAGRVERPPRPHYEIGADLESEEPLATGLVMPAYIHGSDYFATKLVSVHDENPSYGLPTIHAQLVLNDAHTGQPASVMNATRITNARTGSIGGLAARALAKTPATVAVIGAGQQARWQTRAIDALIEIDSVRIYSPSDSKHDCVDDLSTHGIDATAATSVSEAVREADIVVTATTSHSPVLPTDTVSSDTLVIAVGAYQASMQELEPALFERANRVFADVPEEVAQIGDLTATDYTEADLLPLATVLDGTAAPRDPEEIVIVESVGSAVFDAATASHLYERALDHDVGSEQSI